MTYAASLHSALHLPGHIVCSGYRTPGEGRQAPRADIAEADAMRLALLALGVPDTTIKVERRSIDTVTNFVRVEVEGHFGDDRPVAIVAQATHLHRILTVIAPRLLRRDFIGIVVPEPGEPDVDGLLPEIVSRVVLRGMRADSENLLAVTTRRVARI